eukprot:5486251-Pleurochrysis_carterae.AAC.8
MPRDMGIRCGVKLIVTGEPDARARPWRGGQVESGVGGQVEGGVGATRRALAAAPGVRGLV